MAIDLFARCLPFCFAWQAAHLFYSVLFFQCPFPYTHCDDGDKTITLWLTYCAIFTIVAFEVLPALYASSRVLQHLDQFFAHTLLRHDKHHVNRKKASLQLWTAAMN